MTYNVFGGTLNLAVSIYLAPCTRFLAACYTLLITWLTVLASIAQLYLFDVKY